MLDDDQNDRMSSADDGARSEWEADQIVALMGKYLGMRGGNSPFDDRRFLRWLSGELRRRPPTAAEWPAESVRAMRERVLMRAAALRLSVVAHHGTCVERRPVIKAPIANAIELAAGEGCMPFVEEPVAAGEGRALWDAECERWIERPRELAAGPYLALPVTGDSMMPLMHEGDVVAVKLGPAVRRDTVIVARQADEGYVVKRVGEMKGDAIELTSLNPRYEPIWTSRGKNAVLGTVVWRWCAHSSSRKGSGGG